MFARGDSRMCQAVDIVQNSVCEHPNPEDFFANLVYVSGIHNINIVQGRTRVLIDDFEEPECGEFNTYDGLPIHTYVYICLLLCSYSCWI